MNLPHAITARLEAIRPEYRAPPHNVDAEQALLGAILVNNDAYHRVADFLLPEHFMEEAHRQIFAVAGALIRGGTVATPITLKTYLGDADFGGQTVIQYLARLASDATTVVNAGAYARTIHDLAVRRRLITVGEELVNGAYEAPVEQAPRDLIAATESRLLDLIDAEPGLGSTAQSAAQSAAWMRERIDGLRSGLIRSTAIPTGLPDLDRATNGGFQRGQLWILAGRPGMGKTVAMTTLSRLAARAAGVLAFQCEVTRDQQMARYLADLSYRHNRPLPFGRIMAAVDLDEEELARLDEAMQRFERLHLTLTCEPSVGLAQIAAAVKVEKRRLARQGIALGVVFIDYLKFIKVSDRYQGNRVLEIGEITGGLKQLAKAEDICVVLLTQLNRAVEAKDRADRRPNLADLRDSGEIEQDADAVLMLYREAYYLERKLKASGGDPEIGARLIERQNALELILAKNRSGPCPTLDLWCDVAASTIAQTARGPAMSQHSAASTPLPDPLVPADIDVDGIHGFLLHTDRLFHSELWALSTGEEFKAAVALWCHAWRQRPAGSLPDDDRLLAAFSGAGPRWKKVRTMALRGFVLCADGRYYHRVLCEDVLRAAEAKDARRERTAAATRARQRKGDPETTPPSGEKPNLLNETADRNDGRHDQRHDPRDDRRDDTVTVATRGPLRSPREGEEEGKKKDIPAAACDPVPRADGAPPWNNRANFDRVEHRCRTALPSGWCLDPAVGPMARLEADGLDLEREIVPAILDLAVSRRVPIRTWALLANAVAECVAAQRRSRAAQGLPAVPPAPVPPDEMIDLPGGLRWPEADLRTWIARFRENPATWSESLFGPPPGQPGCRIPPRLLIGEAA